MSEPTPPSDAVDPSVCPWCSAGVTAETVTCTSCGAVLITDEEPDLPGVTAVDSKVLRGEKPPQRSRLLSWISGEYTEDTPTEANTQAIAPPDPEVQREIRRLAYEAEVANLQAEADALLTEAVVEGRVVEVPEGIRPLALNEVVATETEAEGSAADDAEASAAEEATGTDDATDTDDSPPADDAAPEADGPAADDAAAAEDAPPA